MNFFSAVTQFRRLYRSITLFAILLTVPVIPTVSQAQDNSQLRHISDDTFLYFGTLQPFAMAEWFEQLPGLSNGSMSKLIDIMLEQQQAAANAGEPGAELFKSEGYASFMRGYANFFEDPEKNMAKYGIDGDNFNFSFYMAGISPVVRVQLDDKNQFLDAMGAFDTEYGYTPEIQPVPGADVRVYEPVSDANGAPRFIVSVIDDQAIIALSFIESDMFRSLGLDAVDNNLANSDMLPALQSKYGYTSDFIGFFDFERLIETVTDAQSPSGQHMITAMGEKDISASVRTPECRSEMQQVASLWPRMVFGYQQLEITDDAVMGDVHMAFEINHPGITGALSKLRGHIPDSVTRADSALSFGLGVDVSRLGQVAGELAMLMSGFEYKCESLAGLNAIPPEMLQQGVMGVNMFSGMAQGVRGFSMALFDLDVNAGDDQSSPSLNSFDAMVTIPAQNPQLLLNMAKAIPQLSNFSVPEDGSAIEIGRGISKDMGNELDVDVNVAQRGQQIVLFSGEQGTSLADDDAAPIEQDNGFFFFSGDIGKMSDAMNSLMSVMPDTSADSEDAAIAEQMEILSEMYSGGRYGYAIDFTENGIEINSRFSLLKP